MKQIITFYLLIIILGCNQTKLKNPSKKVINTSIESTTKDKDSIDYFKRVLPSNGKFALTELTNEFCLVFGKGQHESDNEWKNINLDSLKGFIVNPSEEEFSNLRELRTQRGYIHPTSDSLPICRIENYFLIPFKSNDERFHLTKWNILSKDSIVFEQLIEPTIERIYSSISSIELIELKGNRYLSIYMMGGEGGSNYDEQLILQLKDENTFEVIATEGVGYCHDCGNWARISLRTNPDGFEMIEIRDSMKLVNDKWESVWQKKIVLKTIKI